MTEKQKDMFRILQEIKKTLAEKSKEKNSAKTTLKGSAIPLI